MKQGNNINSPSTCSCVSLQLHLLSLPKRRFSDSRRAFVMSIIAFIALVASFSLKNLPISEKMFVPLSLSMGSCTLLLALQSYKFSATYGNPCALFCDLISTNFQHAKLEYSILQLMNELIVYPIHHKYQDTNFQPAHHL